MYDQLNGKELTLDEVNDCFPVKQNKDLHITTKSVTGIPLLPDEVAHPCGIAARSVFNDTFTLQDSEGTDIPIASTGIAWEDDIKYRYIFVD